MSEISNRTAMELERGRIIAQRAKRQRDLDRYVTANKVRREFGEPAHTFWFYVAGIKVAEQNILDDDYPSEAVMATIALAVEVTVGTEGIPPVMDDHPEVVAERGRRNAYRDKYLGRWREHADRKITAAVKGQP